MAQLEQQDPLPSPDEKKNSSEDGSSEDRTADQVEQESARGEADEDGDGAMPSGRWGQELAHRVVKKAKLRAAYYEENDEPFMGWPTGFERLDRVLAGIHRTGLYLLSGGPGSGKTTLAIQIAREVAQHVPVVYLTLENDPVSLIEKLFCARYKIEARKLQTGMVSRDQIEEMEAQADEWMVLRRLCVLSGTEVPNVDALREVAKFAVAQHSRPKETGLPRPDCLIVVDYLQLWAKTSAAYDQKRTLRERVEALGNDLVEFAHSSGVAVLAISSQNRQYGNYGERRNGTSKSGGKRRPAASLSSLKESGDLEYTADVAMFLTGGWELTSFKPPRAMQLEVLKNRYGRQDTIPLYFDPEIARFRPRND